MPNAHFFSNLLANFCSLAATCIIVIESEPHRRDASTMAPERKFFGEKQFRSKRLPTALWDECKEDILKWREEGGMALVISEMQRVHALSLT